MPLTIKVPPRYRDRAPLLTDSDAPVANIDLAPTLLELAHGKPCRGKGKCRVLDGRSLMPVIEDTGEFPTVRGIGLERFSCDFRGIRYGTSIYVSYSLEDTAGCQPDQAEMYDLGSDPFQLDDLLPTTDGSANDQLRILLTARCASSAIAPESAVATRSRASGHFCE